MRYRLLRFPEGKPKALTLSYDDGIKTDIQLAEILNQYGLKATFNINCFFMEDPVPEGRLTAEDIRKYLLDAGHEVAIHGEDHVAPGIVTPATGIRDVLNCRLRMEEVFSRIINGMAYPDCGITVLSGDSTKEQIKDYLKMLGICYARTLGGDNNTFDLPKDWYEWMPTAHHNNPALQEYLREFLDLKIDTAYAGRARPRLFYVWGHSSEFVRDQNWEVIENLAKTASSHSDVWFATNMEIYDYVQAYHSLVYSADNRIVYNPTLREVWFYIDGKTDSVKPGETRILW